MKMSRCNSLAKACLELKSRVEFIEIVILSFFVICWPCRFYGAKNGSMDWCAT